MAQKVAQEILNLGVAGSIPVTSILNDSIAQLVRALACQVEGCGFESRRYRHKANEVAFHSLIKSFEG